jgi:protein involved in polysaccharide export with SLBB domain
MADVSSALRDGVGTSLPELKIGDTIILPAIAAPGGAMAAPGEGASVLGEVNKPGIYPLATNQDLWSVLAVAGGLTPRGDLSHVYVISRQGEGQAIFTVDLREALKHGTRGPFVVRAGDAVVVGSTGNSAWGRGATAFTQVLAVGRDLLNIAVLADVLKRGNGQ